MLAALLASSLDVAYADHRPFGVLPEGDVRLDFPAKYDHVVTLADGRLLVEGEFARVDGERVAGPVLLDANGRLLRAPAPHCFGQDSVPGRKPCRLTMLALPDGGFVVAGKFVAIDGEPISAIARYRADGTLETAFQPAFSYWAEQQPILIGARLGFLYFQRSSTDSVRRVRLAPPYDIDTTYLVPSPGPVQALDNLGRLYGLVIVDGVGVGAFRSLPNGAVDPTWLAHLPNVNELWHEPLTDSIFLAVRGPSASGAFIVRTHRDGGLDPEWRLERIPGDGDGASALALAVGAGRILSEQFDGHTRWLAVHEAATGRLLRAVPNPLPQGTAFFSGPDGHWIAARPRPNLWPGFSPVTPPPTANPLVRLDADLAIVANFETDIHQIGAAFAVGRGLGDHWLVGGEFGAIGGFPRRRMARMDSRWRVDGGWQLELAAAPRFPIWWLGQVTDGPIVAAEFHRLVIFLGVPTPHILVSTATGTPAQRRAWGTGSFRGLLAGVHLYTGGLCSGLLACRPTGTSGACGSRRS